MDSLFDIKQDNTYIPLADRMRPDKLEDIVGQKNSIGSQSFLYKMICKDLVPSLLLFGPPGCGKTTIAKVIASTTKSNFIKFNATENGIKEIRLIAIKAEENLKFYNKRTILFIDEIHRFNKSQQDVLLPYTEDGTLTLIGATTENPYFSLNRALLSRIRLVRLTELSIDDIISILKNALTNKDKGLGKYNYEYNEKSLKEIAVFANGDTRIALNLLEQVTSLVAPNGTITENLVKEVAGEQIFLYDKKGDNHYDVASAFIKSMRGSDVNAALHYLSRMIESGEKPEFISRRIIISAAEDVGLANPNALLLATSAAEAADRVGFPEARIILSEAVIYICLSPKSNSAYKAINIAQKREKETKIREVPIHLRDSHYSGAEKMGYGKEYKYPHDFGGWVNQLYLPETLKQDIYYKPILKGEEKKLYKEWISFTNDKHD
ncbi:replication-associated recombination protein A [Dialister micraerophilus]|uniref:Recombination factor protein RarA n=1 Tax=Dialister micraerophilus UPII 345-E TaxID=910314 RepID=E4L8V8_9FIRM|nr:replication-associated recombination protein A [Dialister micraerophilus]EFR42820.1 recombination factor protein RarA [Dialister micraerophilus UPII 345-E]MDK8285029.1 replication-associated recombination protein A [Dialister micraerophilus]